MISLRKAVAVVATSALAMAGLVAGAANAQSTQIAINETVKVNSAAAPASISDYVVLTTCTLPTSLVQVAIFGAAGAGPTPVFFTTFTGNSCSFRVNARVGGVVNNAAAAGALVTVTVGGKVIGTYALGADSDAVPIQAGTDALFNITYPSVIVKKVVVGDEVTPGTDYQMHILCLDANGGLRGRTASASFSSNGVFSLKAGATRTFSSADFVGLFPTDVCHVSEISTGGAASTTYTSTKADGTTAAGIVLPGTTPNVNPFGSFEGLLYSATDATKAKVPTFVSAGTVANGQTITVTNSFVGDLIVSKVVTGDPKTSIAIYEINVSCNNNGPKETFLLKDRQSKLFSGITTGTSCLVSETRSDGAEVTYSDNSGDNTTDGRVTIKGTASGCLDKNLSSFPDCRANVIVNNSYVVATTTAATTAAPTTAAAVATTIAAAPPAPIAEPPVADAADTTVG